MPSKEYMREYRKKHPQTPEQLAQQKAYWRSPVGRAAKARYRATENGKRKQHDHNLRKDYGITLADKEKMYEEQKGLCNLCHHPLPPVIQSHYDHDHKTGKARGLLHQDCNHLIGLIEKMPGAMENIASYLS